MLILSKKKEYFDIKKKKNTLVSISGIESQELEIAKLVLYLFSHFCSKTESQTNMEEYLTLTKRQLKNRQPLRDAISSLSKVKIIFYNNNFKKEEQFLFKYLHLMGGEIYCEINSFFKSKLTPQGAGHKSVYLSNIVFQNSQFKRSLKKQARLLILIYLYIKEFNQLDLENQSKPQPLIETLTFYMDSFDNSFINKVIKEYKNDINNML